MTGLVCGERRCGVRCPVCGMSVWDRRKNRMAGCGNPGGRGAGGRGRDGPGPGAGGGGGGGELRRVFESGKFGPVSVVRLRDCAAAPDGTGRSFRNDSRIGRGVMMRRTPEKRPKGPCPGISRPVPSVVCGVGIIPRSPRRGSPRPRQGPSRRCSGPRW